ncbi:MAG: hypothetical protein RKE49_10915 [Oceanicaulis sp.]
MSRSRKPVLSASALVLLVFAALICAASAPRDGMSAALGAAGAAMVAFAAPLSAAMIALVAHGLLERRRPHADWSNTAVLFVLSGVTGWLFVMVTEPFARLSIQAIPGVAAPGALEIAGLVFAGLNVALGALIAAAAYSRDASVSGHDRRQYVWFAPAVIAEGFAVAALVAARLLDWADPGAVHAALSMAFAGLLAAAVVLSWACWRTLDEAERLLSLRHVLASFGLAFFAILGWGFAEAAGRAPQLDALGAFLLMNAAWLLAGVGMARDLAAYVSDEPDPS